MLCFPPPPEGRKPSCERSNVRWTSRSGCCFTAPDTATYKRYARLTSTGGWREATATSTAKVNHSFNPRLVFFWVRISHFPHPSLLQGAILRGMPNTPVSSVTPRGSTTTSCSGTDWPRPYSRASRPTRPCSWPGCSWASTRWATPCTAGRRPRTPASPTFSTAAWTTWPTQRFMSFSTAIRFTRSIWSSSTDTEQQHVYLILQRLDLKSSKIVTTRSRVTRWNGKKKQLEGRFTSFFRSDPVPDWSMSHLLKCLWGKLQRH